MYRLNSLQAFWAKHFAEEIKDLDPVKGPFKDLKNPFGKIKR